MGKDLFSIFCKSYGPDLKRIVKLATSIEEYNKDDIPVYISCPEEDFSRFKQQLGCFSLEIIRDEEILAHTSKAEKLAGRELARLAPNLMQQVVKAEYWRTGLSDNYLIVDSDSYFIRPFFVEDFMADEKTPYTIMHECKDLLSFAARSGKKKIHQDYDEIRLKFQGIFNRNGKCFDFGPTPVIWSSRVWQDLYETYALRNKTNIVDMINSFQSELLWYGEALLHHHVIPIIPLEPLFKVFHYKEQYREGRQLGENDRILAHNYYGVVMQSNWDTGMNSELYIKQKSLFKKATGFMKKVFPI